MTHEKPGNVLTTLARMREEGRELARTKRSGAVATIAEALDVIGWLEVGIADLPRHNRRALARNIYAAMRRHAFKCSRRKLAPLPLTYELCNALIRKGLA